MLGLGGEADRVFPRPHQIAERFVVRRGNVDRGELAGPMQSCQASPSRRSVLFSVLGLVALTIARMVLTFSWLAFWMMAKIAESVRALLAAQADQIAALQRQLAERQPAA